MGDDNIPLSQTKNKLVTNIVGKMQWADETEKLKRKIRASL